MSSLLALGSVTDIRLFNERPESTNEHQTEMVQRQTCRTSLTLRLFITEPHDLNAADDFANERGLNKNRGD